MMLLGLLSFGTANQTWAGNCPCVDKETLTINQVYHQGSYSLATAELSRLQNPELQAMVKASLVEDQSKIKELSDISVNAGIPLKPSDISDGFTNRSAQEVTALSGVTGPDLDRAYISFRANELQRLTTAFDTYFIPEVTTPTMKAWVAVERPRLQVQYNAARALEQKMLNQ